jgi:hypothetical protein
MITLREIKYYSPSPDLVDDVQTEPSGFHPSPEEDFVF